MLAASGTSHNMRERGKDKKQRKTDCGGGGEREGGGSHIAHLQAVNNLEEHWGDKNEDEHKTLAAFDLELELHQCTSQSGESFLPLSLFLTQPSSLPPFLQIAAHLCFCSSASLCVGEEVALRYSCFTSQSMKLSRKADNSVP